MRYDPKTNEWKERGRGDMKLLQNRDTAMVRAVMHQDKTKKCVCNHFLHPAVTLQTHQGSDTTWVWRVADYAEGEKEMTNFALMLKSAADCKEFKTTYDECREINRKLVKKEAKNAKELLKKVVVHEAVAAAAEDRKEAAAASASSPSKAASQNGSTAVAPTTATSTTPSKPADSAAATKTPAKK